MNRRAKIICTLGPATASYETVRALVDAGMDVARLNLSHGTYEQHADAYRWVRQASDEAGKAVGVLLDLQGPKIRLGEFERREVTLKDGDEFVLTTETILGDWRRASTTYPQLARDVKAGDTLLIDDGLVRLEVLATDGTEVRCRIVEGGRISDHKGLNLPGVAVSAPAMSEKDMADLRWGLSLRVDFVALSFVRGAADVDPVRAIMDEMGARLPVIAKLEKPEAARDLEAVMSAFDGLMVARGDLGVEIPLEEVPLVQKRAVQLARERGKPVIVATQMLESMISHSRPTRAEASDVANAVLDGADALMLSGETSVGTHALAAVRTMARIAEAAEREGLTRLPPLQNAPTTRQEAIAVAAVRVARDLGARALVACTETGSTARRMASHRCEIPLLAFTPESSVRSQLAMVWGVETFVVSRVKHTDDLVAQVDRSMLALGRGQAGEMVVIVAGTPPGTTGTTNMLRVHRLGSL